MSASPDDRSARPLPPEPVRPASRWPVAFALVALGGLAVWALLSWKVLSLPGEAAGWAERVAGKLGRVFGTQVQVEGHSFTLEQKEIAELATVQRRVVCVTRYQTTSWGSSATVIIRGVFRAKAGFDLKGGCRFTLAEGGILSAELPPPKLLSLETEDQQVYFASEGLLQKLGPAEMAQAYAENLAQARREAAAEGLLQDAQSRLKERLGDLLSDQAGEVRLQTPKVLP